MIRFKIKKFDSIHGIINLNWILNADQVVWWKCSNYLWSYPK